MADRLDARYYLGSAKVNISQVIFQNSGLPGDSTISTQDVAALYQDFIHQGCHREDYRNHASSVISTQLWSRVLNRCGVAVHATRDPCQQLPTLDFLADESFLCIQGRLCVYAAHMFESADDQWWPFDFYNDAMEEDELITLRINSSNGRYFSDGDIYRNLRYCQLYAPSQTPLWLTRLSAKKAELEQLSSQPNAPLQLAMDALIPYVSEWRKFPLGVLQRLLTMKANKEMIRYLKRIKYQLDVYIPRHPGNLDPSTIENTELLCPADNDHDREKVAQMMRNGQIFQYFSQDERDWILERMSIVNGRILSVHTFVLDTILQDTCSKALRHILPKLGVEADIEHLLRERFDWDKDVLHVELTERKYVAYSASHLDAETRFRLCYVQLWMWAARAFPIITARAPKKDARSKKPSIDTNEAAPYILAAHARRIGFASIEIDTCAASDPHAELTHGFLKRLSTLRGCDFQVDEPVLGLQPLILTLLGDLGDASAVSSYSEHIYESVDVPHANRCGIPLDSMLKSYQKGLYLPLLGSRAGSQNNRQVDSLYIVRDIFECFFGCLEADIDSLVSHVALVLARSPTIMRQAVPARQGRYISPSQLLNSQIGRISQTSSVYSETAEQQRGEGQAVLHERPSADNEPTRSATSTGDVASYYFGSSTPMRRGNAPERGRRRSWFEARDVDHIPSLDLRSDKMVFLLPDGLIHRIDESQFSPIPQMAKSGHVFLISEYGCPRYVSFVQVQDYLLGNMRLIFAHQKGDQPTTPTDSVLHYMETLVHKMASYPQNACNTLTITRPIWKRLLESIFGQGGQGH